MANPRFSKNGGFRVTLVSPARKVAPKPASKATAGEIDRENRARWRSEIIAELIGDVLAEAERGRLTLDESAKRVISSPRGAKLAEDLKSLGGGELTSGKLARLAADSVSAKEDAAKSASGRRLERQLADLESLSRVAASAAESTGWATMYGRHERAAAAIRAGSTYEEAVKLLKA